MVWTLIKIILLVIIVSALSMAGIVAMFALDEAGYGAVSLILGSVTFLVTLALAFCAYDYYKKAG